MLLLVQNLALHSLPTREISRDVRELYPNPNATDARIKWRERRDVGVLRRASEGAGRERRHAHTFFL